MSGLFIVEGDTPLSSQLLLIFDWADPGVAAFIS